jgi:hypothetical protein
LPFNALPLLPQLLLLLLQASCRLRLYRGGAVYRLQQQQGDEDSELGGANSCSFCTMIQIDSLGFDWWRLSGVGRNYLIGGVQFLDRIKVSVFLVY